MIRLSIDVKHWVVGFSVGIMLSIGEMEGDVEVVNNFQIGEESAGGRHDRTCLLRGA